MKTIHVGHDREVRRGFGFARIHPFFQRQPAIQDWSVADRAAFCIGFHFGKATIR